MTLISLDAIYTADSLLRAWRRTNIELFKIEVLFKNIEGLLKDIHAKPEKLKKRISTLEACKENVQWE